MNKLLLTLTGAILLTSCQDKFEQIDANFAFQQEQIENLRIDLDDAVNDLQSQIDDTNTKLDNDINTLNELVDNNAIAQDEVNDLIFSTLSDLESADAEIKTYIDDLNAIQTELLNAAVDQIDDLRDSQESIENDLNALFNQLKIDFDSKFNLLATSNQALVSELFNHLQLETILAWEIIVDNSVTNITETVEAPVSGTASTSTATTTMEEDTPPVELTPAQQLNADILSFIQSGDTSMSGDFEGVAYTITLTTTGFYSLDFSGAYEFGSVLTDGGEMGVANKLQSFITG